MLIVIEGNTLKRAREGQAVFVYIEEAGRRDPNKEKKAGLNDLWTYPMHLFASIKVF